MICKKSIYFALLFLILFPLSGCDKSTVTAGEEGIAPDEMPELTDVSTPRATSTPKATPASGSEYLTGTWVVGAVYINDKIIDIHDNSTIEGMYDTIGLTFTEDGRFHYMDVFNFEGTYEMQEQSNTAISFLLRTSRTYRYHFEDDELSEVDIEGSDATHYVLFTDANTFEYGTYDPITGKGKLDDSILYFVRSDANSDYISDNKMPLPSSTPEPDLITSPAPSAAVTMGEQNALAKAKDYLSFMAFSYKGLVEQLEYEGYLHSEAVYGADHCGADWNEQAALKAASYLELMSFSRSGLIEQLEYEGFTHAQAVYGAEQNGY